VIDFMPSAPIDSNKLKELSKSESLNSKSKSSNYFSQPVEAPILRNARAPTDRFRTTLQNTNDQQSDEMIKAKEELKGLYLIVKRLIGFSKLTDNEKEPYKKQIETIESLVFNSKLDSMDKIENLRIELNEEKKNISQK